MNGKDITVSCVATRAAVGIFQNLHFHTPVKRLALSRVGISPDKNPRIATRLQVPPFHLEDKILVHLQRPQLTDGLAGAVNHPLLHRPRSWRTVNIPPTLEGFAIEEGLEPLFTTKKYRNQD